MGLHSYNHGLVTSGKGVALESFRITAMNTSPCTVEEQFDANLVASVTISTGVVTVQFNKPYPPKCTATAGYSSASATDDIVTARVRKAGYSATAGTLIIDLSNDDDAGDPAAASPAADDELTVHCAFTRYKN
jgi:hypothetical protein